jgi:DNA-binding NtrC family response regulator
VVDDEEDVRSALKRRLEREGYQVSDAADSAAAKEKIEAQVPSFDLVISDMSMEEADSGLNVLQHALSNDIFTEVIVLTAYGNVANAVESMRRGAFDYLEKNVPGVDVYELLMIKVQQALERRRVAVGAVRRLELFSTVR